MTEQCPTCSNEYKRLGTHWSYSPNHRPNISESQRELITGLLMGDGWVRTTPTTKNPIFAMEMITKSYIDSVAERLKPFTTKVVKRDRSDENGVSDTTWVIRTCSHPDLFEFNDWYQTGQKVFPEDIKLTPTTLKSWYVCDGSFRNNSIITIHSGNEYQNSEKIRKMFTCSNLPTPDRIYGEVDKKGHSHGCITFTVPDSEELVEYMGQAPDGFGYKFPNNERY